MSITLDTFPTRIMKQSVRRQPLRRIFAALQQEEARQWTSRSCGCSSEIPPDHEFQFLHCVMFCLSAPMIKQFFFHPCPDAFTSRIIMASSSRTVHALHNAIFLNDCPICSTGVLSATVGMHNGSADFRKPQIRIFQCFTAQFGTHMIRHCQTHWQ